MFKPVSACERFCRCQSPKILARKYDKRPMKKCGQDLAEESLSPELQKSKVRRERFLRYCENVQTQENLVQEEAKPESVKEEVEAKVEDEQVDESSFETEEVVIEEEEEYEKELSKEEEVKKEQVSHIEISKPVTVERNERIQADTSDEDEILVFPKPEPKEDPRIIFPILPETKTFPDFPARIRKRRVQKPAPPIEPVHSLPPKNQAFIPLEKLRQATKKRSASPLLRSKHVHFDLPEIEPAPGPESEPEEEPKRSRFSGPRNFVDTGEFLEVENDIKKREPASRGNYDTIYDCIKRRVGDPIQRKQMLIALKHHVHSHFLLLLMEPCRTVEGVYRIIDERRAQRLCGDVPNNLSIDECKSLWRYSTRTKNFIREEEKEFTPYTDAVSVAF